MVVNFAPRVINYALRVISYASREHYNTGITHKDHHMMTEKMFIVQATGALL